MRTIIIIEYTPFTFESDDYIIAVEKGALECINKIKVDVAVGDFDSVSSSDLELIKKNFKTIVLPEEKDVTDLDYAIQLATTEEIIILGGIAGRRVEHFFGNMLHFKKYPKLKFMDNNSLIYLINDGIHKYFNNGYHYISFFSYTDYSLISLENFKYELNDYHLGRFDSLCISNEASNGTIIVKVGSLLVIETKKDA